MASNSDISKSLEDAVSSLRTTFASCVIVYLILILAFPKLLQVSDEERTIPHLQVWSALQAMLPLIKHGHGVLGLPCPKPIDVPDLKTLSDGANACLPAWKQSPLPVGWDKTLTLANPCPWVYPNPPIPGFEPGNLLLVYAAQPKATSILSRLLLTRFVRLQVENGCRIESKKLALPDQTYVIAELRSPPAQLEGALIPLPMAGAMDLIQMTSPGTVLPYPGTVDFLHDDRVLWRAGKRDLLFPKLNQTGRIDEEATAKQNQEIDKWLAERLRDPPKVTVFGLSADLQVFSSVFGAVLLLFAFNMVGPLRILIASRGRAATSTWTLVTPREQSLVGVGTETAAIAFSATFVVAPLVVVFLEIWYGILRPLGSAAELMIAAGNVVAVVVAGIVYAWVCLEFWRRRRLFVTPIGGGSQEKFP